MQYGGLQLKLDVLSFSIRNNLAPDPGSDLYLRQIKSRGPLVIRVRHVQWNGCSVASLGSLVRGQASRVRMRYVPSRVRMRLVPLALF